VVTITNRGSTTLERLTALDGVQEALLEPLSANERATFLRLLTKMVRPEE